MLIMYFCDFLLLGLYSTSCLQNIITSQRLVSRERLFSSKLFAASKSQAATFGPSAGTPRKPPIDQTLRWLLISVYLVQPQMTPVWVGRFDSSPVSNYQNRDLNTNLSAKRSTICRRPKAVRTLLCITRPQNSRFLFEIGDYGSCSVNIVFAET